MLYPGHSLIAGGCILIEQPCVCLAAFFVQCGWISLFLLMAFNKECFWYIQNSLGRAICEEGFEQLASVINFHVCGGKSIEKCRISVTRGCFIKDYLWRDIEVGTLYFSANCRLTTPRFIACKKSKHRQLTRVHPCTRSCRLYPFFAVKKCIIRYRW